MGLCPHIILQILCCLLILPTDMKSCQLLTLILTLPLVMCHVNPGPPYHFTIAICAFMPLCVIMCLQVIMCARKNITGKMYTKVIHIIQGSSRSMQPCCPHSGPLAASPTTYIQALPNLEACYSLIILFEK